MVHPSLSKKMSKNPIKITFTRFLAAIAATILIEAALTGLYAITPALAVPPGDVFGGTKLHAIEQQILSLAEASQKDISYQEHQKLLDTVSDEIVAGVTDLSDLATLAIWAYFNVHSNEFDGKYINYNHVVRTAFSSAIAKIGKQVSPEAQAALLRIARQVNLDGHVSEELCEAMSSATGKKTFTFGDRVYTRFQEPILEKLPLSPELASFRIAVCEELWKHWKSPIKDIDDSGVPTNRPDRSADARACGNVDVSARATFVIDQDRQFTNIKVVPIYSGKIKNQSAGNQFVEAARSTLEHCALSHQLPDGLKRVRVEVDFYGR